MNGPIWKCAALAAAMLVVSGAGWADSVHIQVDELGNGWYTVDGGVRHFLTSYFQTDPSGGIAGDVRYYQLPKGANDPFGTVISGDVLINEPDGTGLSDIVRFYTVDQDRTSFSYLIFYSDQEGIANTDDSGLPLAANYLPNRKTVNETGDEGNNSVQGYAYPGSAD